MDPGLVIDVVLEVVYAVLGAASLAWAAWYLLNRRLDRLEREREARFRAFLEAPGPRLDAEVDWGDYERRVAAYLDRFGPGEPISDEQQAALLRRAAGERPQTRLPKLSE